MCWSMSVRSITESNFIWQTQWRSLYAAQLLQQPRTPGRRMKCAGERHRRTLPPFGEVVVCMQSAATRQRRTYEDRWDTGIYSGLVERSNMLLVGRQVVWSRKIVAKRCLPTWAPTLLSRGTCVLDCELLTATEPIVPEEPLPPRVP